MPGRDADWTWTLGMGIIERLGGLGGKALMAPQIDCVGEIAREGLESAEETDVDRDRRWLEGVGIWLGVFGRLRGGETVVLILDRPGVRAREGGRYIENGEFEDCAVEDDVTGDHGRPEAIELRETLRLDN